MERQVKLNSNQIKIIDRALYLYRTQTENFYYESKRMFGDVEESDITSGAWDRFVEAEELLSDFLNGQMDIIN
jgi:hypothetical protein